MAASAIVEDDLHRAGLVEVPGEHGARFGRGSRRHRGLAVSGDQTRCERRSVQGNVRNLACERQVLAIVADQKRRIPNGRRDVASGVADPLAIHIHFDPRSIVPTRDVMPLIGGQRVCGADRGALHAGVAQREHHTATAVSPQPEVLPAVGTFADHPTPAVRRRGVGANPRFGGLCGAKPQARTVPRLRVGAGAAGSEDVPGGPARGRILQHAAAGEVAREAEVRGARARRIDRRRGCNQARQELDGCRAGDLVEPESVLGANAPAVLVPGVHAGEREVEFSQSGPRGVAHERRCRSSAAVAARLEHRQRPSRVAVGFGIERQEVVLLVGRDERTVAIDRRRDGRLGDRYSEDHERAVVELVQTVGTAVEDGIGAVVDDVDDQIRRLEPVVVLVHPHPKVVSDAAGSYVVDGSVAQVGHGRACKQGWHAVRDPP